MARVPLRRLIRGTGLVLSALGILVVVGVVVLVMVAQGPRFGWLVTKLLPATAGQISLGGGRMNLAAWSALLTGRRAPIYLNDLLVTDPEGTVVLSAATVTAEAELHFGPMRLVLRDLRVVRGSWRLAQMKSRRGFGFYAAFASPKAPRAPRRPRDGVVGPFFQIANADLQGVDVVLDFPTWGLTLKDIWAHGALTLDGQDPQRPLFTFDVTNADARDGGALRVLRESRAIRLPFERAEINRVGIARERPTDIVLDVKGAMTGRSRLRGTAVFGGGSRATGTRPGIEMNAALDTPASALNAIAAHSDAAGWRPLKAAGRGGVLALQMKGPYDALQANLGIEELDVAYGRYATRRLRLKVTAALRPLQIGVHDLAFSAPGGGRVNLDADVDPARQVDVDLRLHHLVTDSYLPPALRSLAGGTLTGRVAARGGLTDAAATVRHLDLTLNRTGGGELPRTLRVRGGAAAAGTNGDRGVTLNVPGLAFAGGTLTIRRLSMPFPVLGGRLTLDGQVGFWDKLPARLFPSPRIALTATGTGIDLHRSGLRTLFGGRLAFRADARGTVGGLAVRLTLPPTAPLTILGGSYVASAPIDLRVAGGRLTIPSLRLQQAQPGGPARIEIHGELGWNGDAAVDLAVNDHPLAALPGLRGGGLPLSGMVDAQLRLRGSPSEPTLGGALQLRRVVLRGVPLGDGQLTLTPEGRRRARVTGSFFHHFDVAGTIVDEPRGPSIQLGVDLRNAPLDPLLPAFPLLQDGRGTASGRVTIKLQGGEPAAFDGAFTGLALSYAVRSRIPAAGPRPRVGVRNAGPVTARMRGWGDELTLDESGLDLGGGPVRVAGRLDNGRLDVKVDGPLALEPLQPFVAALTDGAVHRLGGLVRAQLKLAGGLAFPILQGQATVVRPLEVAIRQPADAQLRINSGTLALAGTTLRLDGLHARLTASLAEPAARLETTIRADGRLTGFLPGTPPILSGRIQLSETSLALRSPAETIRVSQAVLVGDGRVVTIESLQALVGGGPVTVGGPGRPPGRIAIASLWPFALGTIDVPVAGRRINWSPVSGVDVDELDFDLTIAGDARRSLSLSGDIRLIAGRFLADVPAAPAARRPPPRAAPRPAPVRKASLLDRVTLDLRLRTVGDRFVIKKSRFPALHLDLDARARGLASNPRVDAQARATDLYGMLALLLLRLMR